MTQLLHLPTHTPSLLPHTLLCYPTWLCVRRGLNQWQPTSFNQHSWKARVEKSCHCYSPPLPHPTITGQEVGGSLMQSLCPLPGEPNHCHLLHSSCFQRIGRAEHAKTQIIVPRSCRIAPFPAREKRARRRWHLDRCLNRIGTA